MPMLIATIAVSFLPMFEATMIKGVFAQTTDGGGVDDAIMLDSGTYETSANGNNNASGPKFLFIQSAQSGSISEVNASTSTLELNDVSDKTIMFSDRPDRIVASESTVDFIGNWSMGPNSFNVDPPNAVLILDDEKQKEELAVIELYNPVYDPQVNTLRYEIAPDNATSSISLPSEFGQSTLVIDSKHYDMNEDVPYVYKRD